MPRFIARERKHRKLARAKQVEAPAENSNATEIVPESQQEREARRELLRQQIRAAQPEGKASSQKRKRLEKYIDTKLKKDDNAELLRKLEAQRVDTSLLQSSKKLGRVNESKREKLQRALRERDAGINEGDDILFEQRTQQADESTSEDEEHTSTALTAVPMVTPSSTFGSGLKRPLDVSEDGRPVIRKRKRRKRESDDHLQFVGQAEVEDGSDEWEGFSSAAEEDLEQEESEGSTNGPSQSNESDSESEDENQAASSETSGEELKPRISAFKAWADSQRNAALDFVPSANHEINGDAMKVAIGNFKPRLPTPDPDIVELQEASTANDKPTAAITIERDESVQTARLELPVVQEEQRIMEAINRYPVVVVCGATGSGKTTQVPQMLLENGYAPAGNMIGVTQPRRVAATSVASRVTQELGPVYGKRVAHQVRYDTSVKPDTAIKFMTDGILLREIQQDFVLSKYRAIVLDEAHERSVNTDLLIGMLSRIVPLRAELAKENPEKHSPLKLIMMSATLSQGVDSFLKNEKLWARSGGPPPVIEAEVRQYPVTVHFARRTRRDFLSEIIEKVAKGHRKLPPGGMLVFLTGQQEIWTVAKKLRGKLGGAAVNGRIADDVDDNNEEGSGMEAADEYLEGEEEAEDFGSEAEIKLDDADDAEFMVNDIETQALPPSGLKAPLKPHILPLYAALPANQQLKVFQPAPDGCRSIVLSTNVAETSLTIPGVRYVFDSGRVKEKRYDTSTGVQTFEVDWVSKASAEQRKGRAGRTGPGHVWRLYSSNVYEEFFANETIPEVLRTPLESTVLQLKAMQIDKVMNFPFPTQPELHQLEIAERLLVNLGAIQDKIGTVTKVGRDIMKFPVSPRFGKMLMLARTNSVVAHAIAIVAALAVGDLFIPETQAASHGLGDEQSESDVSETERQSTQAKQELATAKAVLDDRHQKYTRAQAKLARWDDKSDAMKLLMAVALHADAQKSGPLGTGASALCQQFSLREKGMEEVQLLRRQLHNIMGVEFSPKLSLLADKEIALLNQVTASGFVDQVAIRTDLLRDGLIGRKPRRAIEVPYRTLFDVSDSFADDGQDDAAKHNVYIHPSSVLARLSVKEMPDYIVYSHLSRAAPNTPDGPRKKTRMHPLTAIGPRALATLAEGTPLLQIGRPIGKIEDLPRSDAGKQRRQCWLGIGLKAPGGTAREWPLGAWKVVQVRGTRDWEIEKVVSR